MTLPSNIPSAVAALNKGELVGMPTETVYGLAADATNPLAIARVFEAKTRPHFNPLISHVADINAAQRQGHFSEIALALAKAFWPGPLTLVVPRQSDGSVCDLACAGLETIALRVPAHPVALELLTAFGKPLAAPSANISGRPSPTLATHVQGEFGNHIAMVLDGGPCQIGLESTVIGVFDDRATLLRHGGLERAAIELVCGQLLTPTIGDDSAPRSPGMLLRHYAPNAPVLINQTTAPPNGLLIGFGDIASVAELNLSARGDVREAATNLFAMLRAADALSPEIIAIAPIPNHGLGEAINDRLIRAQQR